MIKGSTVLELYDKIEKVQREYERLDCGLTAMEYYINLVKINNLKCFSDTL
jgi:hypothetical protein